MSLPLGRWTNFLALLGRVRRNRRQRQAAAARRRSMVRRHAVQHLEDRVCLDAAPIAVDISDSLRVRSDEPLSVNMSAYVAQMGGYDPDGGDVTIVDGQSPPAAIALMGGQDYTWSYTIQDEEGLTDEGTIHLTGVSNHAPTANDSDDDIRIPHGQTTVDVNLDDYAPGYWADEDGDDPTLSGWTGGVVTLGVGLHAFGYTLDDGWGAQASGEVRIHVLEAENQDPTAGGYQTTINIGRDETGTTVNWDDVRAALGATDPDDDSLSIEGPTGQEWIGVGTTVRTFNITDGFGGSCTATATINVQNDPNRDPTASDYQTTINVGRDETGAMIDWADVRAALGASDPDGDTLSIDGPTGQEWLGTGQTVRSFNITDGHGGACTATATINVVPAENRAPSASDYQTTINVGRDDTGAMIDWGDVRAALGASDPDGDTLSIDGPTGQEWLGTGQTVRSFNITDGHGGSCTATATINVVPAENRAPSASDYQTTINVGRDDTGAMIDWGVVRAALGASDPDGDTLSIEGSNG